MSEILEKAFEKFDGRVHGCFDTHGKKKLAYECMKEIEDYYLAQIEVLKTSMDRK